MTLSEAISEGLLVTGVGLLIVFSVLLILMLALMAMKVLFYKEPEGEAKKAEKQTEVPKAPVQAPVQPISAVQNDKSELIAVLTAAIAASLNTSTHNFNIKSFRRIGNNSPVWNRAGVTEMINSRL